MKRIAKAIRKFFAKKDNPKPPAMQILDESYKGIWDSKINASGNPIL